MQDEDVAESQTFALMQIGRRGIASNRHWLLKGTTGSRIET